MFELHSDYLLLLLLHYSKLNNILANVIEFKLTKLTMIVNVLIALLRHTRARIVDPRRSRVATIIGTSSSTTSRSFIGPCRCYYDWDSWFSRGSYICPHWTSYRSCRTSSDYCLHYECSNHTFYSH